MNNLTLLLLFLTISVNLFSQDSLITTDGKIIGITEYNINETEKSLNLRNTKGKNFTLNYDEILLIKNNSGEELYFYSPDTVEEDYFDREQMKLYVNGILEAKKNYNNYIYPVIGFITGAASMAFSNKIELNPLVSPIVPVMYVGIVSVTGVKIPLNCTDKYSIKGYRSETKRLKIKNSILASLGGIICGGIIYYTTPSLRYE